MSRGRAVNPVFPSDKVPNSSSPTGFDGSGPSGLLAPRPTWNYRHRLTVLDTKRADNSGQFRLKRRFWCGECRRIRRAEVNQTALL